MNFLSNHMRKYLLITLLMILPACTEHPPVMTDGDAEVRIVALWEYIDDENNTSYLPLSNAIVTLTSEYGIMMKTTNEYGELFLSNMPTSEYGISVRMPHPDDNSIIFVGSITSLTLTSGRLTQDTILAKPISSFGLSINEIYSAGPVNSIFYFYDQYLELYNSTDSIKYLDGIMIMRVSGNNDGQGPGADEYGDGSIQGVTYAFKFPGSPGEKNHPIYPKQFLVLAQDAVNHKNMITTSFDLTNVDWEFYNQFSPNDIDNPNVPNLINMKSDHTTDFFLNLISDVVAISTGEDSIWTDGIRIDTIIDAVEYQTNPHPVSRKTLDSRVDRGYVLSPPRYSGLSMKRREPGLDTNNSSDDFNPVHSLATPGFH